jgi:hypothetical protein
MAKVSQKVRECIWICADSGTLKCSARSAAKEYTASHLLSGGALISTGPARLASLEFGRAET